MPIGSQPGQTAKHGRAIDLEQENGFIHSSNPRPILKKCTRDIPLCVSLPLNSRIDWYAFIGGFVILGTSYSIEHSSEEQRYSNNVTLEGRTEPTCVCTRTETRISSHLVSDVFSNQHEHNVSRMRIHCDEAHDALTVVAL